MEIKKNRNVDLDAHRWKFFLLSLIVVLASFVAILEYSSEETTYDGEDEELTEELDLSLFKKEDDRIALAVKEQPKPVSDEIKVEKKTDELEQMDMPKPESDDIPQDTKEEVKDEEKDPLLAPADNALDNNDKNFRIVSDLPQFPGGAVEMMKWLTANLRYPSSAQRKKIEGKVMVQFIIDSSGDMTDLKIIKSLEASCDREALRVMRMMPKWKPGIDNGQPCRTMVCIPIVFKL